MTDSGDEPEGIMHMNPDILYSDERHDREILEHVIVNDRLPDYMVKTIGYMERIEGAPEAGEGLIAAALVTLPSNPCKAAGNLYEFSVDLMSQGSRKTKDIRLTLEALLMSAEENIFRQTMRVAITGEGEGGYAALEESMQKVYRIYGALPEDSESTLKEDIRSDPGLQVLHEASYEAARQRLEPMVADMLNRNPEYKPLVDLKKLVNAYVNVPSITPFQLHNPDMIPSDVVLLEEDSLKRERE